MDDPIFSPVTVMDVEELFINIRANDLQEIRAIHGYDALEKTKFNVAKSLFKGEGYSMRDKNGKLILIFGVTEGDKKSHGVPWFFGTNEVNKWVRYILIESPKWIEKFLEKYPILYNLTDLRNKTYHRWLSRMGFRFFATHLTYGKEKVPFMEFGRFDLDKMGIFEKEYGYV